MLSRTTDRRTLAFALLLFVALMVRAAVPQGYMIAPDRSHGFEVAICGAEEMWQLPVPADSGQQEEDPGEKGETCYLAGGAFKATSREGTPSAPVPGTIAAAWNAIYAAALAPPLARPLPPARAPPTPA